MKKSLLLAVALVSATTGFAQTANQTKVKAPSLPVLKQQMTSFREGMGEAKPSVRHSLSTNNYFTHPEGTFYVGWGLDNYGSILTSLAAPLTAGATFTEAGSNSPAWKQAGSYINDATGNSYTFVAPYAGQFYAPYTVVSRDSFCVGSNNIYTMGVDRGDSRFANYSAYSSYLHWGLVGTDSVEVLRPVDDHAGYLSNGSLYGNGAYWGGLSTDYMYGSGTIDYGDDEGIGDCFAVEQIMGKTTAPLYVERVAVAGITHTSPIKNDGQLVALVTGVRTITYRDGSTALRADLNNVYDTLYATATDTLDFATEDEMNSKTIYEGKVLFSKKTVDDFGTEVEEPFIIPADSTFAIYLTGFQDTTNVDFGVVGLRAPSEETATESGHFLVQPRGSEYYYTHTYNGTIVCNIALVGMYDGVLAPAHPGLYTFENDNLSYNTVKISDDGQTNLTNGATASIADSQTGDGLPGALVATTVAFFDGDGNANYAIDDLPDWVTNVQVMALDVDYNLYVIAFTADALPAGTAGRAATVHVTSEKGAASEAITLIQGDETAGINGVAVDDVNKANDNRIFNLAGQQVNKAYKGVVIKNGHKFIQK